MSTNKRVISVMIPTYNEEENVRPIYEAVRDELTRSCPDYAYEILFIDNKSEDGTRREIERICAQDAWVKAIFNSRNFGQFNSPYYGMIHTSGDCTITMCADFQDPVEMIPRFVAEWEKGFRVVIGKKTASQENRLVYALRGSYYRLIRKMSSIELIEQFTGFGLYDRSFIDTLRSLHDPTPFIRGIVAELGPDRREIEYTQPARRAGKTHNSWYTLFDAAMLSFTSYTKVGMRMAEFFGFFCAAASFIMGLFFFVAKLIHWNAFAAGYVPIIIAVFFVGGVQLTFLGFLGEYIMAMNTRIMNRPLVVEERRLNFDANPPGVERRTEPGEPGQERELNLMQ